MFNKIDRFEKYMSEFFLTHKKSRVLIPTLIILLIVSSLSAIVANYLALLDYTLNPRRLALPSLEFYSMDMFWLSITIVIMLSSFFLFITILRSLKKMESLPEYVIKEARDLLNDLSLENRNAPEELQERLENLIFSQALKRLLKKGRETGGIKSLKKWLIEYKKLNESDSKIKNFIVNKDNISAKLKTERINRDNLKRFLVP